MKHPIVSNGIFLDPILKVGVKKIGDFCGRMAPPMILVNIIACLVVILFATVQKAERVVQKRVLS